MDIGKYLDFKINARHARTSILGFVEILRSKGDGYVEAGEEVNDLGIQDADDQNLQPQMEQSQPGDNQTTADTGPGRSEAVQMQVAAGLSPSSQRLGSSSHSNPPKSSWYPTQTNVWQQPDRPEEILPSVTLPDTLATQEQNAFDTAIQWFHDPALLELFPDGEIPDLGYLDTMPANFYDPILGAWDMSEIPHSDLQDGFWQA